MFHLVCLTVKGVHVFLILPIVFVCEILCGRDLVINLCISLNAVEKSKQQCLCLLKVQYNATM